MSEDIQDSEYVNTFEHWKKTSEEDFNTMLNLFNSETYHWALFLGHICLEKLLKSLYVKTNNKFAPLTHNLLRLAEYCNLEFDNRYADWLDKITFNINARYDDYKKEFKKQCTPEFTNEWIEKIKELRKWIEQKF